MSVKPLDIVMSITHSQNIKTQDPTIHLKNISQNEIIIQQNIKNKESIPKIPDEENHTQMMETLKQGMSDNSSGFSSDRSHHHNDLEEIPERALLDSDSGHNIDIIS